MRNGEQEEKEDEDEGNEWSTCIVYISRFP